MGSGGKVTFKQELGLLGWVGVGALFGFTVHLFCAQNHDIFTALLHESEKFRL